MQPLIVRSRPLHSDSGFEPQLSPAFPRCWPAWTVEPGRFTARIGFAAIMGFLTLQAACAESPRQQTPDHGAAPRRALIDGAAREAGLTIAEIVITGRLQLSEAEVLDALGAVKGQSILAFDAGAARARIMQLGWVKTAEIKRLLPATLTIELTERTPFAVWRKDDGQFAVDNGHAVLGRVRPQELSSLLRIAGADAPEAAPALAEALAPHPAIRAQLKEAERTGRRRWTLHLDDGLQVKLPEAEMREALGRLAALLADASFARPSVAAIDLRAPGQIAVQFKTISKENRQKLFAQDKAQDPSWPATLQPGR